MDGKGTLILILARGGSKGIPKKNIKYLFGKPMINYTIDAALQSRLKARVIVSTDDQEIARVAKERGAEVPFMRPHYLAQDDTPSERVIDYTLEVLQEKEEYLPHYLILLQPTSPMRTSEDIYRAMQIMENNSEKADAVISVTPVTEHPFIMRQLSRDGMLTEVLPNFTNSYRRQDLPEYYRFNGAIYITTLTSWERYRSFVKMEKILPYVMPTEKSVDIDNEIDWKLTEILMGGYGE